MKLPVKAYVVAVVVTVIWAAFLYFVVG